MGWLANKGLTPRPARKIRAFEEGRRVQQPWLFA